MATSSRYEPNCAKGARLHAAPAAPRRVLLVEDHEDTRFMLKTALEMRGLSVTEADNGEAALFLAGAEHPDLILMDGSLPRLDGIAVTRLMRQRPDLRDVPIVFLSGHAELSSRQAAFAAGCDDYLVKPVAFDQLDRAVSRHLPAATDA